MKPSIRTHTVQQPQQAQPAAPRRPLAQGNAALGTPVECARPRPFLQIDLCYVRPWVEANLPLGGWTQVAGRYLLGLTLDEHDVPVLLLQDVSSNTRQYTATLDETTQGWYERRDREYCGDAVSTMWTALLQASHEF